VDISVEGADQLGELGKRLRAAGEGGKGMRKELLKRIRETAKGPLSDDLQQAALRRLPARGGLAATAAKKLKVTVRTRLSGSEVGVTAIVAVKDMDIPKLDAGKLRHPVYGHDPWVNQKIPSGIFSDAVEEIADSVRDDILSVFEDIAKEL